MSFNADVCEHWAVQTSIVALITLCMDVMFLVVFLALDILFVFLLWVAAAHRNVFIDPPSRLTASRHVQLFALGPEIGRVVPSFVSLTISRCVWDTV